MTIALLILAAVAWHQPAFHIYVHVWTRDHDYATDDRAFFGILAFLGPVPALIIALLERESTRPARVLKPRRPK